MPFLTKAGGEGNLFSFLVEMFLVPRNVTLGRRTVGLGGRGLEFQG